MDENWANPDQSVWTVINEEALVFADPDSGSPIITKLMKGTAVVTRNGGPLRNREGRWLEIENPVSGFVRSHELAPEK